MRRPAFAQVNLDPRWRLAAFSVSCFAAALLATPLTLFCAWTISTALIVAARVPLRDWLFALAALVATLLLYVVCTVLILKPQTAAFRIGVVVISTSAARAAIVLVLRAGTILNLLFAFLLAVPLHRTLSAARSLGVPSLFVHLTLLAGRYVNLLADQFRRMRLAMRVRAFRARFRVHYYRTMANAAGTLLVCASERADRVNHAMRCRGFNGRLRSLMDRRTTIYDVLTFITATSVAAALLAWDWSMRRAGA